jgi:replicative DNA helicase
MYDYRVEASDLPEKFHRIILSAILGLYRDGKGVTEIDAVAIDDYVSKHASVYQLYLRKDGPTYVERAIESCDPKNIKYYHTELKKMALLRAFHEQGFDVSDFFDPDEVDPEIIEKHQALLDVSSPKDIADYFRKKLLKISEPFALDGEHTSKKAGSEGHAQVERWKQDTAWGIGYASAYMTTILHGLRQRRFTVMSAGSGVGKTRMSIANICNAGCPYLYDKAQGEWVVNPNANGDGVLYIGTEMELLEEIDPILWAYIADVPQEHIEFNLYVGDEEARVHRAISILENNANIWLEYVPEYDTAQLETLIENHVLNHDVKYVFFDYIHSTVSLVSEYSAKSNAKMTVREDQILGSLSNDLKKLARKYNVSIDSATQVSGDFKNTENRDETIVRGAKAIIDKTDSAMIAMPPTTQELRKIGNILSRTFGMHEPNLILSIYKNRGGKYKKVKIWLYVDYDTMRVHDLFVTDYEYNLLSEIEQTYIAVSGAHREVGHKQEHAIFNIQSLDEMELDNNDLDF